MRSTTTLSRRSYFANELTIGSSDIVFPLKWLEIEEGIASTEGYRHYVVDFPSILGIAIAVLGAFYPRTAGIFSEATLFVLCANKVGLAPYQLNDLFSQIPRTDF